MVLRKDVREALDRRQGDKSDTSGDERSWALAMLMTQKAFGFESKQEERTKRYNLTWAEAPEAGLSVIRGCGCSCVGTCTCRC